MFSILNFARESLYKNLTGCVWLFALVYIKAYDVKLFSCLVAHIASYACLQYAKTALASTQGVVILEHEGIYRYYNTK